MIVSQQESINNNFLDLQSNGNSPDKWKTKKNEPKIRAKVICLRKKSRTNNTNRSFQQNKNKDEKRKEKQTEESREISARKIKAKKS